MAELYQLQEQEIPEAMTQLKDSHTNLKKVADYCEGLYLQATDKKPALEETRGYTTQALASVAYQINTLATSFLSLLDLQARQLVDMESSINHLSQTVSIHKEKIARREIGVLTTNKSFPRPIGVKSPGIIFPEQAEKPIKYIRKPIDYTLLDSVGAGGPKTQIMAYRKSHSGSVSSAGSGVGSSNNVPRHSGSASSVTNSLSRARQPSRAASGTIPPPVAPPTVPSHYMSALQLQNSQQQSNTQPNLSNPTYGYAPGAPAVPAAPPPNHQSVTRMNSSPYQTAGHGMYNGEVVPPAELSPPLPPMPTDYNMNQDMPPPPPDDLPSPAVGPPPSNFPIFSQTSIDQESLDDGTSNRNSVPFPPPLPNTDQADMPRGADPPWAPQVYMEKVVAIFDYEPQQNDDELSFRENAILYVIKKNSDGWWEGVMESEDGQPICGLFPENYVESLL